ncbi:MAG: transglycosylase SLT domain-containing protein, partial [Acidobacteriota bacterium]|nr:transglycosylase SLT domain-containing protein [Acidobacteriota bacterium]
MLTARAFESLGNRIQAVNYLRRTYFFAADSVPAREAESKLVELQENLEPNDREEILQRSNDLFMKGRYSEASAAFEKFASAYPQGIENEVHLKRVKSFAKNRQMPSAAFVFGKIPVSAPEKPEALFQMAVGYAMVRDWDNVSGTIGSLRRSFPKSKWTPKAMVTVGNIAGEQKRLTDKNYYLRSTLAMYPDSVENVDAQFELAWNQHELKNFDESSRLLTEHLARYVDRDTSYRGQSGYWAARDSEKAGKIEEACALYDATIYRYGANWYGYQALQRLSTMRSLGKCQRAPSFPPDSMTAKAIANLKVVTVAAETATERELARAKKSDELSTVGLFDWAIEELVEAKKTADNSPRINFALAKHYRLKGDNVRALLALKESYPDYPQMFPEEMGREEWDIFYPLTHWNDIKFWSKKRNLDPYNVAGLIRQETIFNPKARSSANAYGLMQLLIPTARSVARKYGASVGQITGATLFNATFNIELGTAYMREQLDKYGRIEYMSVAYNAGPGRVVSWRRTLPLEMDEFVEEIPFSETRGYVKGVIRNTSQYRRLYDEAGRFKQNVGARPIRAGIDKLPAKEFAAANPEIRLETKRRFAE